MIELPEGRALARQAEDLLKGKIVTEVFPPSYLHKFTFFSGDPAGYGALLKGKKMTGAKSYGMFVDLFFEGGAVLSFNDGVNIRYGAPGAAIPGKYQLLITFGDGSFIWFAVAMYGGIALHDGGWENKYYRTSVDAVSPLDDRYDRAAFDALIAAETTNITAKALLATEQRIPGLGNGALQDILFHAGIHPKRKIRALSEEETGALFRSLKNTLKAMSDAGGRDTETDMSGKRGGYKAVLSKNTLGTPCPRCGTAIVKEAYMGGAVYFCPECQKL